MAFLSILPVIPFAHKLHRSVSYVLVLVLAGTVLYNVFAFPFSENSPFKVFFQQQINLNTGENNVTLSGASPWVNRYLIPEIPSSWSNAVSCLPDPLRANMPGCKWSGLSPTIGSKSSKTWLSVNTTLDAPGAGSISISGEDSRNCRLYFDANVTNVSIRGSSGRFSTVFPFTEGGVKEVHLWSRTWDRTFDVSLGWNGASGLSGRVACEWAEPGGINALEEVTSFLPRWARVTKRTDGLLEGWKDFSME